MATREKELIEEMYGGETRVRVSGFLIKDERLLLLKHLGLGDLGYLWLPPGGGVNVGESLKEALMREFREETGLQIKVGRRIAIFEFQKDTLHAIEFFYQVAIVGNDQAVLGFDPELPTEHQLIKDLQWVSDDELQGFRKECLHQLMQQYSQIAMLNKLDGGVYTFSNNPNG